MTGEFQISNQNSNFISILTDKLKVRPMEFKAYQIWKLTLTPKKITKTQTYIRDLRKLVVLNISITN
jgi:hypothetical protein